MRVNSYLVFTVLVLALTDCGTKAISESAPVLEPKATSTPTQLNQYPEPVDIDYANIDSVPYNGYQAVKLGKKAKIEASQDGKTPEGFDNSYVLLKKNGKVVYKFVAFDDRENAADFGLFSFLGKGSKQLAVSLTIPRGGRHWVVDLSDGRIIFDSGDYGVGREEFSVVDIDGDGVFEISLPLTEFYMFEGMSMAETPLPEIIFKYDNKIGKYVPANPTFSNYSLRGIEDEISRLNPENKGGYMSRRLDIVLRYIYTGDEQKAWDFFDREYMMVDKEEIKSKIKATIAHEAVYKYIYKR